MHHPTKGKCARRGCFLCPTTDGAFSLHCHFLAVGVCPVSFRRFAPWLSFLFPLGQQVSSSCFFWGRPRSPSLRSCSTCFPPPFLSFSALFGCRQSLVFRSSKNSFCTPSLACARRAPARPVFRIIAFTSSPNAHNLLIWSVLR